MDRRRFLKTLGSIATYAVIPPGPLFLPLVTTTHRSVNGWGVCIYAQHDPVPALNLLRPQVWQNYSTMYDAANQFQGRWPVVWGSIYWQPDNARQRMNRLGGERWLLMNEPERWGQADEEPAASWATTSELIDIGREYEGFEWSTPQVCSNANDYDGLAWLSEYIALARNGWGDYPPSYIAFHSYSCTTPTQLRAAVDKMRSWRDRNGLGHLRLILSEYCAHGLDPSKQMLVMDEGRRLLDQRIVEEAMWFAAYIPSTEAWPAASLTTSGDVNPMLTGVGEHWMNLKV